MEQPAEEPREFVDELKPGTKLLQGQYTIVKFINAGGFGITYLAKNSLGREVVIKECFPGSFCRRSHGIVAARSRAHENEFEQIVKLFVQEAKSLSRLIHPNIVGVHQVFEDNDTAYMAIDYIEGRDLLDIIEHDRALLKPPVIAMMLKKLLGAVAFIHDNGMLHRDISPDNILISRSGEPVLIDFGAARQQATRIGGKALSALRVVKDGYSPQEFYVSGTQQSPSSDLYALAASFYHLISGQTPPNSQARLVAIAENGEDPYQRLAGRFDGYPDGFLEAIDDAISVLPKDRIQSAKDWLDRIAARPELKVVPLPGREQRAPEAAASLAPETPAAEPAAERPRRGLAGTAVILLGTAVIAGAVGYLLLQGPSEPAPETPEESAAVVPAPVAPEPEPAAPATAMQGPPQAAAEAPVAAPEPATAEEATSLPPAAAPEPVAPEVAAPEPAPEIAARDLAPEVTAAGESAAEPAAAPEPVLEREPRAAPAAETAEAATALPGAAPAEEAAPAAPEAAEPVSAPEAAEPAPASQPAEPVIAAAPQAAPAPEAAAAPEAEAPAPEIAAAPEATSSPEAAAVAGPTAAAPEAPGVPEAAPETADAETALPAAPATEALAAAPEPAPVAAEPASAPEPAAEPEPAAPAPEPAPSVTAPAAEAAQPEPAAEAPAAATTEEMVAEAQALTAETVALRQVANAGWTLALPFETTTVGEVDAFPTISRVLERADRPAENDWIGEGVTVYAINDTFVSDQAAIERVLSASAEFGVDHFFFASARIKAEPSAEFEDVTLAARTQLSVDLANGVSFQTEPADGRWQTVITAVASPEENGLRVGDVVLTELVSGEELTSSRTLEFAVNRLARAHRPVAVFAVERNGESVAARMTLAMEN